MKFSKLFLLVAIISVVAMSMMTSCSSDVKSTKMSATDVDSASYSFGVLLANQYFPKEFYEELNVELLARGIIDGRDSNTMIDVALANELIKSYNGKLNKEKEEAAEAEGAAFLAKMAANPNVKKTASGLLYEVITPGTGISPVATDTVATNYKGTFVDGKEFDAGQGIKFALNRVIPGWTEGIQLMKIGAKYKFYLPTHLAYGPRGNQGIPPNSTLVFEVDLLEVIAGPPVAPTDIQ